MTSNIKPSSYVLYIDDEEQAVKYFQDFFESEFPILSATSVQEAREILHARGREIAILVSDQRMPTASGVELLSEVNQHFPAIIRVLTTAYASLDSSLLAINQGHIFAYVTKPWNIDELRATLHSAYREFDKRQAVVALAGSIAHEMRNPLSQLKYSLDAIEHALPTPTATPTAAPTAGDAQQLIAWPQLNALYEHLAQGQRAIERGVQVIAMTLDAINAKDMEPQSLEYLSAEKITRKALEEYGYASQEERAKVSLHVVSDFTFKVNETAYLFVLFNLIKNALYYFTLKPTATLTITVEKNCVKVKDTGPGISEAGLAQLFQAFHTSGKTGGTGLGLSYCRRVMHGFGGSIVCDSTLGQETTFTLSFPEVPQAELDAHRCSILSNAALTFEGKRILLVDDQKIIRDNTRNMLKNMGCAMDEAENGMLAIEQLKNQHYDAVLLDLNMPVLDGYAVAQKIRAGIVAHAQYVPLVAYSSEVAYVARIKTQKLGMDGFVSKPCSPLELIRSLQQALELGMKRQSSMRMEAFKDKKVLIVDDELVNRRLVDLHLKKLCALPVQAEHGAAALAYLHSHGAEIDLVLMDMHMPGLNGLETTRAIRATPSAFQQVPIIALTADDSQEYRRAALEAGINGFLAKPIDVAEIHEKLGHLFLTSKGEKPPSQLACTPAQRTDPSAPSSMQAMQTMPAPPAQEVVLNVARLDYIRDSDLEFLLEALPVYLGRMKTLIQTVRASVEQKNHTLLYETLHSLLGISGDAGALTLHAFLRNRIYAQVHKGAWPEEANWLETIEALFSASEVKIRAYWAECEQQKNAV